MDINVKTYIHRYPAAELWETCSWYVKIKFADRYVCGPIRDAWYKSPEEAKAKAKEIAEELGGTYEGED